MIYVGHASDILKISGALFPKSFFFHKNDVLPYIVPVVRQVCLYLAKLQYLSRLIYPTPRGGASTRKRKRTKMPQTKTIIAAASVLAATAAATTTYAALSAQSQLFGKVEVGSNPTQIALTFDDGPNDVATERLLEALAAIKSAPPSS